MSLSSNIYIVRHSERLDEIMELKDGEETWSDYLRREINNPFRSRTKYSILSDTPITKSGHQIARNAGKTLRRFIHESSECTERTFSKRNIRVYSSRLRRCLETAYNIARELGVYEVFVSTGLSLTSKGLFDDFQYLSISQISDIYEAISVDEELKENHRIGRIQIIDCDDADQEEGIQINHNCWLKALRDVGTHKSPIVDSDDELEELVKVIVGHRETIKAISPRSQPITVRPPYCCIAKVNFKEPVEDMQSESDLFEGEDYFDILGFYHPDGEFFSPIIQ